MAYIYGLGNKRIPANRLARIRRAFEQRLERVPLMRHPGFRYDIEKEGFSNWTFGGRYAFCSEFGAVCHDLAHAVEFGPDTFETRCTPWGGFNFEIAKVEIAGRFYPSPSTGQATERECRTYGIEAQIARLFGVKLSFEAHVAASVHLCRLMPDWHAYHGKPEALAEHIRAGRELYTDTDVLARLEGWFDWTVLRLREQEAEDAREPQELEPKRPAALALV